VVNIDQRHSLDSRHYLFRMKTISPRKILAIRCPTCGAAPGEKCELSTGLPRTTPHRDRRLIAAD
jgi:hypothetical protein